MRSLSISLKKSIQQWLWPVPWLMVACGIVSAGLLVLSFPSYSIWQLCFIGLVPFLMALFTASSWKDVVWLGVSCSSAYIWFGFRWIGFVATSFGGLPWIVSQFVLAAFSLFGEIQFLLFALLSYAFVSSLKKPKHWAKRAAVLFLLFPVFFVSIEFLYPKLFPSSFGMVLYYWLPVAQLAEYSGIYGFTFPAILVNVALAVIFSEIFSRIRRLHKGPTLIPFGVVALIVVGGFFLWAEKWGTKRLAELEELERSYSRSLKVSVIQANIGDLEKASSERGYEPAIQRILNAYRDLSLQSVKQYHPDLLIWPETSYPFLYTHFQDEAANRSGAARDYWIRDFLNEIKTSFFFGSYSHIGKRDYNTAFLLTPPFDLNGVYRKSILLAFGEYVPLGPFSSIVQDLVPSIADFGRGKGPDIIKVNGIKLAPQICYEGIFPEHSRGGVKLGADILLNITNDSWFGPDSEPWLHLLLTVFRSIELRRPMIRATNTGISTLIKITGEMQYSTALFKPATIDAAIPVPGPGQSAPETFYFRHGELFAHVCVVLTLLAAGFALFPILLRSLRRKSGT